MVPDQQAEAELVALLRSALTKAASARQSILGYWDTVLAGSCFQSRVWTDSDRTGHIDVELTWPPPNEPVAARDFGESLRTALNTALALALTRSQSIGTDIEFPLARSEPEFEALVASSALGELDQAVLALVEECQPFRTGSGGDNDAAFVARLFVHLDEITTGGPSEPLAVWCHSANPSVRTSSGTSIRVEPEPAGAMTHGRTIGTFVAPEEPVELSGNPGCAFDLIFNAPPWPIDPDDNLGNRTRALLDLVAALTTEILNRAATTEQRGRLTPTGWTPLNKSGSLETSEIRKVERLLDQSDLGIAEWRNVDGALAILVRVGGESYLRNVPSATRRPIGRDQGPGAEDATLSAASLWGLPDFVLRPQTIRKGNATRELGDGTIICGNRGLAIQVKSRVSPTADSEKEARWISKKAAEAIRQARGSIRSTKVGAVFTNARGRQVKIQDPEIAWVAVAILDHDGPPEVCLELDDLAPRAVVLLRRDWEFLFDQLRSTTAVVAYVHRISVEPAATLGAEPARYFELAIYDSEAPAGELAEWMQGLGGVRYSTPLLPMTPVGVDDQLGLQVFRVILEDTALSPFEWPESDRLALLGAIDRIAAAEREALGRLLLDRLRETVRDSKSAAGVHWKFRRFLIEEPKLQIAFAVCSAGGQEIQHALSSYVQLRHADLVAAVGDQVMTLAIVLTPRTDGRRLWDTTCAAMRGAFSLDPEDRAVFEQLWGGAAQFE